MGFKKPWTLFSFISLCSAIGFGLIALFISDKKIVDFDTSVTSVIHGLNSPFMTSVMKFFTFIGAGMPVVVIIMVIMLFLYQVFHHRSELILFAAAVIGSAILNALLKLIFQRARPIINRMIDISGYSFPSGHAMGAFTLYTILAFLLWRHIHSFLGRVLLLIFCSFMILMIGLSRIYLGVHYPSDVLAGFLASLSWLAMFIWIFRSCQDKRNRVGSGV
jgi:undecaprenyl-diphosphatase